MIKLLQKLFDRPMTYLECAFIDMVDGSEINYYRSPKGKKYMATSKWGLFRVECK